MKRETREAWKIAASDFEKILGVLAGATVLMGVVRSSTGLSIWNSAAVVAIAAPFAFALYFLVKTYVDGLKFRARKRIKERNQ